MAEHARCSLAAIVEKAKSLGAGGVGFAPAERWNTLTEADAPSETSPRRIWPKTNTVIVLTLPLFFQGSGVSDDADALVSNVLDFAAYRLAVFLNQNGYASVNLPADADGSTLKGYEQIRVFSHEQAAKAAGLGNCDAHGTLRDAAGRPLRAASVLSAYAAPAADGGNPG